MTSVAPWSIVARNLTDHASNPIHTDAGARAAGFPRALVAGVTTYTYCVHPIAEHWGEFGEAIVKDLEACQPLGRPGAVPYSSPYSL